MAGITMSSVDRIIRCGHESVYEDAQVPEVERPASMDAAAERGKAAHWLLETGDLDEAMKRWPVFEAFLRGVRKHNPCGPAENHGWELEDARVLDTVTWTGHTVAAVERDYPPTLTTEIAGRLDRWTEGHGIVGREDYITVEDYKTGSSVPAPEWSGQLRVQALSLRKSDEPPDTRVVLTFVLIHEDGRPERISHAMTMGQLVRWGDSVLAPALERYARRRAAAVPGDHCMFCPARRACAALRASPFLPWEDLPRDELYQRWKAAEKAAEDMEAALKRDPSPVDAGGGKVWGPGTAQRTVFKSMPVLTEIAGRVAGERGVPMALDLDAAKKEPWWDEAERMAREAGAITTETHQRWTLRKGGKP